MNFGRSGAGAPVRDSQGQVRAVVMGNPEIRYVAFFQPIRGHMSFSLKVPRK